MSFILSRFPRHCEAFKSRHPWALVPCWDSKVALATLPRGEMTILDRHSSIGSTWHILYIISYHVPTSQTLLGSKLFKFSFPLWSVASLGFQRSGRSSRGYRWMDIVVTEVLVATSQIFASDSIPGNQRDPSICDLAQQTFLHQNPRVQSYPFPHQSPHEVPWRLHLKQKHFPSCHPFRNWLTHLHSLVQHH